MAYDFALDAQRHDLVINENDFLVIDDAERVAQQIKIQLLTFLGEWFLDVTHGMPYLDYVLVKNPNIELIRQIFREAILSVDDVKDVNSIEIDYDARQRVMKLEYEAETAYGLVTRKEVLGYGRN